MTNDIERRIKEHKEKLISGFSKKYGIDKLVYFETFLTADEGFKREQQMKRWKREWKLNIIEKNNPNWEDLAKEWD